MLGYIIWFVATLFGVYLLVRRFLENIPIDELNGKAILITGCDSGFGHSLALKCLTNGCIVYAGCFTQEVKEFLRKTRQFFNFECFKGMQKLNTESQKIGVGKLRVFELDVREPESIEKAKQFVNGDLPQGQGTQSSKVFGNNIRVFVKVCTHFSITPALWQLSAGTIGLSRRTTNAFGRSIQWVLFA